MTYRKVRVDPSEKPNKKRANTRSAAKKASSRKGASLLKKTKPVKPKKMSLREAADKASWHKYSIKDHKTGKMIYKTGFKPGLRQKDL